MHNRIADCPTVDRASSIPVSIADWANSDLTLRNAETKSSGVRGETDFERLESPLAAMHRARRCLHERPDQAGVEERFGTAIADAAGSGKPFSILWIDFDGFDGVNAVNRGAVRRVAADRLRIAAHRSFVSRVGEDAFAIVVEDECQRATVLVQRLLDAFDSTIRIDGQAFALRLSIGIAVHPRGSRLAADADTVR